MNRRRRGLRRIAETAASVDNYRVENPSLFASWVWISPPDEFDAPVKRGRRLFEEMAHIGYRVELLSAGWEGQLSIWRPWTFIVGPVPAADVSAWVGGLDDLHCSVIFDCHFPIMNLETAIGADDQIIGVIDRKDVMLANLALADAVTVPHPSWATDLAEVNPNVFLLPDYDDRSADRFGIRLAEIAQTSMRIKLDRQRVRKEMGL